MVMIPLFVLTSNSRVIDAYHVARLETFKSSKDSLLRYSACLIRDNVSLVNLTIEIAGMVNLTVQKKLSR